MKIYFYDLGIRNSLIQNFNPLSFRNDVGGIWENFFILERLKFNNNRRKFLNTYYWRTYDQKGIDYLEESDGILHAFECKFRPDVKYKFPAVFSEAYPESNFDLVNSENFWKFLIGEHE